MEQFLKGKSAIVTGSTKGIGRAIAASLAEAGASVVVCGRKQKEVDDAVRELSNKGQVVGTVADVTRPESIDELFRFADEQIGGLDILVNNAGVGVFKSVADLSSEDWAKTIDTNLNAVFHCCHAALPRMRERGSGFIINISSLAGKNPFKGGAAYNASKFGLNGFTEAMMLDHRNDNIRVSAILPGSVDTGFGSGSKGATWKIAPEDIAQIVLDLLRMPTRTLISRVEVRPSKPQQS